MHNHVDIFLDESGDLGFAEGKSSRYFIVCALATAESHRYRRIVRTLNKRFRIGKKGEVEFKFNNSSKPVRFFVLDEVAKTDSWIVWGGVEKKNAKADLQARKDKLYNYVCGRVISGIFAVTPARSIHLIVDKRAGKNTHRNDFDRYAEQQLATNHAGYFPPEFHVSHFDSRSHEELQVVDFCAGAVFQDIERDSDLYLRRIQDLIRNGRIYW